MFTVKRENSAVIFYLMTHAFAVNVSLLSELPIWNNIMSGNYALCVLCSNTGPVQSISILGWCLPTHMDDISY